MHSYDPGEVVAKGQLGPGQIISVDTVIWQGRQAAAGILNYLKVF